MGYKSPIRISIKWINNKKPEDTSADGRGWAAEPLPHLDANGTATLENSSGVSYKTKHILIILS